MKDNSVYIHVSAKKVYFDVVFEDLPFAPTFVCDRTYRTLNFTRSDVLPGVLHPFKNQKVLNRYVFAFVHYIHSHQPTLSCLFDQGFDFLILHNME